MGIKLEEKYIKNKIKAKFGELEVYNPQLIDNAYDKLSQMIRENSATVSENEMSDVQINNTVKIVREMLINLTNIEDEVYWNNIDDIEMDNMLNLADGDFKIVVHTLMDIMLEIGQDLRLGDIRKLDIINNKLIEMKEAFKADVNINKTLTDLGLDKDKLVKLQQGDQSTIDEFQQNIIKNIEKQNKPKRQYTKKSKK
jgi:hypothetical protein